MASPYVSESVNALWSDIAVPEVSRMSRAGFPEPMSGFDQIAGRFVEGSHPYASVPTLAPSAYPCNRSGASASFATLLLLSQLIVCCIHRLNLQPIPAIQVSQEPPVSENQVLRTWTPRSGHWRVHTTGQEETIIPPKHLRLRWQLTDLQAAPIRIKLISNQPPSP